MKTEIAGITRANEGIQGISWSILGQTYVPKNVTEHSFSWHATFPPETFVPPHIHPDQDEYLYILEGQLDFFLDGAETQATPGDLVRLPMGKPHGIFNKSGRTAKTLFWVSPQRRWRKAGLGGIAAHDRLALGVAQHLLDVSESIRRQLLDRVDHALGAAAAVRAHDLRRHRQALLLI